MRILLTAHRFWPSVGGTEACVLALARAFRRRAHDVTVATSLEPGTPEVDEIDGVTVRRFSLRRLGRLRLPPPAYARFVLDRSWDVVHLHGQQVWSSDHLFPHLVRRRRPTVLTPHGLYQLHMEPGWRTDVYYRWALSWALARVDQVVAITETERDELVRLGGDATRITRIPDGIDLAEFERLPEGFRARHRVPPGAPLLLALGGFYRNKRIDRLIEAFAMLRRPDARLMVMGPTGDARSEARARALAAPLGAGVSILGTVPRAELCAGLGEADLLVSASEFEGFGLALLEAMAAGLPFVATPVGAAAELVAHGGGRLAAPTPAALAAAIADLLAHPKERRAMGCRGRRAVADYSVERVAGAHLELYADLIRAWRHA